MAWRVSSQSRFLRSLTFSKKKADIVSFKEYSNNGKNNEPISFLNSKAKDHKFIKHALMVDEKDLRKQKYAMPLGITVFITLMYFIYIKDYGDIEMEDTIPKDIQEELKK